MAAVVAPPPQAGRLLALLLEDDRSLQEHALRKLHGVIDSAWAEASEQVAAIEALAEDESLPAPSRQLAAAVASKVRPPGARAQGVAGRGGGPGAPRVSPVGCSAASCRGRPAVDAPTRTPRQPRPSLP